MMEYWNIQIPKGQKQEEFLSLPIVPSYRGVTFLTIIPPFQLSKYPGYC